jgi:two-component system heavy metal sensor histidine kinase CusS
MSQSNLDQRIPLPFHHDELYRLAATINALFGRMQDAFQREKHFTADASHELKTPLAVVKGTLEVLIRKPREREHYETKIQFCLKELNRMARLIDQLLMLARYESNKMTPHIVVTSLFPLLENVVERMLQTAITKGIAIILNQAEHTHIAADPGMLEMMLENIISNAIKYSSSGSSITIEVKRNEDNAVCSISDQGIGIPEEKLNAIFERFYRVDESRSSSTGGLGLGLSIVKKLADLQQINVTVTSATNLGTTFSLTCPAAHNGC